MAGGVRAARWVGAGALALALGAPLALFASTARAEQAWVKDELRLNIRTGPGIQYRILGVVKTGDLVSVLERGDGWTRVRIGDQQPGWIPEGYLQSEEPARVSLARSEEAAAEFEQRVAALSSESAKLRSDNEALAARDESQTEQIEQLTRENLELRAGARWPEWIAGAGLLGAGMVLGAILHRNATRRPGPRIRL